MSLAGRSPSTSCPQALPATVFLAYQQCLLAKMLKQADAINRAVQFRSRRVPTGPDDHHQV